VAKKAPAASKKAPAKVSKPAPKKPAAKPVAAKAAASKSAATKPAAKPEVKPASKPVAKPVEKTAAPKAAAKPAPKTTAKAAPAKPVEASKPAKKTAEKPAAKAAAEPAAKKPAANLTQAPVGSVAKPAPAAASAKPGAANQPPRPMKRPKAPAPVTEMPAGMGRLLDPKGPVRKPLIPSGPKAQAVRPLGAHGGDYAEPVKIESKCPFNKRELEKFRAILLRKRAELVGDINTMENEALRGQTGALSNSPNHMAEQGSEAYDQALSLDLAAADRKLIREIDDALQRINDGTYGLCIMTGRPIKAERLEELPWARYSIEAAREMERQSMRS
jgi:RNA polymerase-binding protein DksA